MRVYIWDFTHDRYYPALVSENATIGRLLSQITPQIVKERGPGRQMVAYLQKTGEQLYRNPQGRYVRRGSGTARYRTLHPWQTLASIGVTENEVLVLCYFIQPGVKTQTVNLRKRLQQEHEWLDELAAKSDLIEVEPVEGDPPTKYRVTFKCRGIMLHPISQKPALTANHIMEIYLPAGIPGYPNEAPYVLCLTPHFHPNISPENNMVCIGIERDWESSLDIAWLVTHLAAMITYRVYGFEKPYNQDAVKWTKANKAKLPLDKRPLFKEEITIATRSKETEEVKVAFEKPFEVARTAAKSAPSPKAKRAARKATVKKKTIKKQPAKKKSAGKAAKKQSKGLSSTKSKATKTVKVATKRRAIKTRSSKSGTKRGK